MKQTFRLFLVRIVSFFESYSINNMIQNQLLKAGANNNNFIDPKNPLSWEFSGFSQNGEDGIINYLANKILKPNKYFVEIGASYAIENNTSFLAIVKRWSGLMIEGDKKSFQLCKHIMDKKTLGVECLNIFVNKDNIAHVMDSMLYKNPDLFSLDIDGIDYYLMEIVLKAGIKPKIIVVEYNSAFGPENSITVKYKKDFNGYEAHSSHLYYGVSLKGWQNLFNTYGYTFITVDSNGVNGFFVDKSAFNPEFISSINGLKFQENFYQYKKFKSGYQYQFKIIEKMDFEEI
jgi:hypothetical protein